MNQKEKFMKAYEKKRFQNSNLRIKNVIFGQLPIQPNMLIGKKPGELFFRTSSLPSKKFPCAYLN
jgi:hypothetical protein